MNNFPILAIMTLFMGAFVNSLLGRKSSVVRNIIVTAALLISFTCVALLFKPVFLEGLTVTYWMGGWVPIQGYAYGIGLEVDALSLFFAMIVEIALLVSGIYSFTYMAKDDSQVNFYTLFLMLGGSVLGLVLSGDLFNVFVMVEIMTFTAVALTAFRNDYEGALEGAFKYLVVGSMGSMCILLGTGILYANVHSLNISNIALMAISTARAGTMNPSMIAGFGFLFVGFATKAFLFPFQPLAADAHAVAPASISLMISGVLTKCGVYGLIRLTYTIFNNIGTPAVSYLMVSLGCITMFICVTMAFNQHNFKRLLAFHSISQVGYVITAAGIGTSLGVSAALFHAMNHTLFKGLLFLCAGAVQHETGSLDLDQLGGLHKKMPRTCLLFLIGAASISGLPPFNGFGSKWMIYNALYQQAGSTGSPVYLVALIVALITSVLTLASFVKVAQSVFFGQLNPKFAVTEEAPVAMRAPIWVLGVLCIGLGVFMKPFTSLILVPAAGSVTYEGLLNYIYNVLAGANYAQPQVSLSMVGQWDPIVWLILLVLITCAITLVSVSGPIRETQPLAEGDVEDIAVLPENAKYEPFFSGEESHYSQVGGSDLFWGFKHNWKKYFSFWHSWHSGIVNDYELYGVVAMIVILAYCLIFV